MRGGAIPPRFYSQVIFDSEAIHPRSRPCSGAPNRGLRKSDAVPRERHSARLQPLRLLHSARGRTPERVADGRVAGAGHSSGPRHHACSERGESPGTVSYTHLRAHETVLDLVCRLLLEKKKKT